MAEKTIKGKVLLNKQVYQNYYDSNPILKKGELVFTTVSSSSAPSEEIIMMKLGDGTTNFRNLNWVSCLASDVYEWAKAETKPEYTASEIKFSDGETLQQKEDNFSPMTNGEIDSIFV